MNKRFLYGIICIVLSAVIAFGGIPLLASQVNAKTTVVKITAPIAKGSRITAEQIALEEVGKYGLSPNTYADLDDVVGQYAATDLVAGAIVLPENLSPSPVDADLSLRALPSGKLAVAFSIKTLASGLSDKLQTGDIIRIYHYAGKAEAVPELQYVKVLAVTDTNGANIDPLEAPAEDGQRQQSATVVVQASPAQAQLITGLENNGTIHVALVLRGNEAQAQELLAKQDALVSALPAE